MLSCLQLLKPAEDRDGACCHAFTTTESGGRASALVGIGRDDQIKESAEEKWPDTYAFEQIEQTGEAQQCMVRIVHFKRAGCM